jgi:hypothetical protein
MNIAKLYFDKDLSITITADTLINGCVLDSKCPDLSIRQILAQADIVEISNTKHTYFLKSPQVKFIKMLKTK